MRQITLSVGKLKTQMNGKLSFQALNPKRMLVLMLQSGKELGEERSKQIELEEEEEIYKPIE